MNLELSAPGSLGRVWNARLFAWGLWSGTVVLLAATSLVVVLTPAAATPRSYQPNPTDYLFGLMLLAFGTVGALVMNSQPRNRIGWLCAAIGLLFALQAFVLKYAAFALFAGYGAPAGIWSLWVTQWIFAAPFLLVGCYLPLLFPTGRLPTRGWLPVAVLATLAAGALVVQRILWPEMDLQGYRIANPTGISGARQFLDPLNNAAGLALVASFAASAVSLGARFQRADYEQRQQLKWFTSAVALLVMTIAGSFLTGAVLHFGAGVDALIAVGLLSLPVAIAIAILHNRLFDIDLLISRTVLYGALAAFITVVYLVVVLGAGTLLGTGTRGNVVLSIVATAIVALAFQPVRARLQRLAARFVYGTRATPYEVLSEFGQRVAESYASEDILQRMARVLAEGTAALQARVWLRVGGDLKLAAIWPAGADGVERLPYREDEVRQVSGAENIVEVRHRGELLGLLTVNKRPGENLTPIESKLLKDLARQAGLVLRNERLTAELMERMAELQASRQRLVAAQDQERRRLERNLHDGAQQQLVGIKLKLTLAETLADKEPGRARQLMSELKQEADEALETLRDLARGIYPPILVDRGLQDALQVQARRSTVPVEVNVSVSRRYSPELEATVYFCCLEAIQNALKHAKAGRIVIKVEESGPDLSFCVSDDGAGFDPNTSAGGSGLQNMRDRLDALGGSLEVSSAPGTGTEICGRAPLAAREQSPT